MTFKQGKDESQQIAPFKYPLYVTYVSMFLLLLTSGANIGWSSPMVKKLNGTEDNPIGRKLTENESSWVASISILGTLTGSLICGALGRILGRKTLITAMGVPFVIFYVTLAFAKKVWLFLFARFIGGISVGGLLSVLPLYVSELVHSKMRGRFFVLIGVSNSLGMLLTYSVAPYISIFLYHICFSILPIIFLILFPLFAVESPYYMLQKDPVEAEKILKKLRNNKDVTKEIERMNKDYQKSSDMNLKDVIKTRETRKALLMMLGLSTFLMITGYSIVMSYTHFIFESAGAYWSAEIDSIILSAFQLFMTLFSSLFADKFGRKTLFSISFGTLGVSEAAFGSYLIFKDNGYDMSNFNKWLPILSLLVCAGASSFIAIAPSVAGELFSMKAKNVATSICTIYASVLAFFATLLFQKYQNAIGMGQSFLVFAALSICAAFFVLTVLIETKGKTLEQIQDELGNSRVRNTKALSI